MKVDLGQCAVCGAKNSKYVEQCYKCGAALPWAPDYVAPKSPQKPAPKPSQSTPTNSGVKTVVVPPNDNAAPTMGAPTIEPIDDASDTAASASVAERANKPVAVPAWALGAGGLGLVVLGMGLWALLGQKPVQPALAPATPSATATAPALAPIVPAQTPALAPDADANATAPVVAPTARAASEPTPMATLAPTEAATPLPAPGVAVAPAIGPNFDELYANLTTGTPQQQSLYWDSVEGQQINWRGEFVSLGSAATGPLVVNCKNAKGVLKVTITLDATKPQTLPSYQAGESVPFSGVLESRSAGALAVKEGRVG